MKGPVGEVVVILPVDHLVIHTIVRMATAHPVQQEHAGRIHGGVGGMVAVAARIQLIGIR